MSETVSEAWVDAGLTALRRRIDATEADPAPGFPHYADPQSGRWVRSTDGDWTGGFWAGLLWLTAATTDDDGYRERARAWARLLRPRQTSDTVFRGFLFWYGAALGSVLLDDEVGREVATAGAHGLADLYNPAARLIPLGEQAEEASSVGRGEANIDGVPGGSPLLAWGAGQPGGSTAWREIAVRHAARHIDLCVRADGSVCQSASFDPTTGTLLKRYTHKGITDESTWTRAQAWAMLGFAQAAAFDRERFLGVALRVGDWWVAHLPSDAVAYWDFDAAQAPPTPRDTSGTAIASAALLKLAAMAPERAESYRSTAETSARALVQRHLAPSGALVGGCYNHRTGLATSHELIWGDYFLYETLNALAGRVDPTVI